MAEKTTSTQPLGTMTEPRPASYTAQPGYPSHDDYVPAPAPRPSFADRLRTPVAGAILGGVVILGVGFGAGYLVGNDSGASSSVIGPGGQIGQTGQTGQGFGQGFGPGQTGGGMGGFGSQQGTGQQGLGQTQDGTGTTQDGATQDGSTTTSFVA